MEKTEIESVGKVKGLKEITSSINNCPHKFTKTLPLQNLHMQNEAVNCSSGNLWWLFRITPQLLPIASDRLSYPMNFETNALTP